MRHPSKSRVLAGWQCRKRLWLEAHEPGHARFSAQTERAFRTGHEVGDLARRLFPGGTLIGHDAELSAALEQTGRAARAALRDALRRYCTLDTWAMVRLARFLGGDD